MMLPVIGDVLEMRTLFEIVAHAFLIMPFKTYNLKSLHLHGAYCF